MAFSAQTMWGTVCPAKVAVCVARVGDEFRLGNWLRTVRQNRQSQKGHWTCPVMGELQMKEGSEISQDPRLWYSWIILPYREAPGSKTQRVREKAFRNFTFLKYVCMHRHIFQNLQRQVHRNACILIRTFPYRTVGHKFRSLVFFCFSEAKRKQARM